MASKYEQLDKLCAELRELAREFDCVILTAKQPRPYRTYSYERPISDIIYIDYIGILR